MTSIRRSASRGPTEPQFQPQDKTVKGSEIIAAAGGSPTSASAAALGFGDSFQAAAPRTGPFSSGRNQTKVRAQEPSGLLTDYLVSGVRSPQRPGLSGS